MNATRTNVYVAGEIRQVRNIGDFSSNYEKKKTKCMLLAFFLVLYSAICLGLFILNVNVVAFFSVGAFLILIKSVQCGFEYFEEGARTQRAYRSYLGSFSYNVLVHARKTEELSSWSKYEIDQYLANSF